MAGDRAPDNGLLAFLSLELTSDLWLRRIFSGGLAAFAKMNMEYFNTTRVTNAEQLVRLLRGGRPAASDDDTDERASGVRDRGLITVLNHVSGLDDPCVLAAVLPPEVIADLDGLRWTLCATDRCFRSRFWAHVFPHVKVIPVVRGAGIDQPLMDVAVDLLSRGEWLNVFPEGTRTQDGSLKVFRAGVGRLVADAVPSPYVVPIAHRGMENMLPLGSWLPRFRNRIEIAVGEPMLFDDMIDQYRRDGRPEAELYIAIASALEDRIRSLLDTIDESRLQ